MLDDRPPRGARHPEADPLGEQTLQPKGRKRARRIPHEGVTIGSHRSDEQELAPLQLGYREAVLEYEDVNERKLLFSHPARSRLSWTGGAT
jgi:hypothetical protein